MEFTWWQLVGIIAIALVAYISLGTGVVIGMHKAKYWTLLSDENDGDVKYMWATFAAIALWPFALLAYSCLMVGMKITEHLPVVLPKVGSIFLNIVLLKFLGKAK